jgi:plasmid replication initiation protein
MLDILFMVLSCLEKDKLKYTIHTHDIEAITGRKWNYKQLRDATEDIGSRMFEIETPEKYRQLWLFEYVDYIKGSGSFTVKINETAKPYFFDLKNNFTAMQLKSVLNCSSKYAKRLYAIACQWRSVGTKRFEIPELKKMLGLIDKKGNEQFERISDFKIKVLDIARKQISENTDIELDYELKKKGREFYWITLNINSQKFKQLEIDFEKPLNIQKFASKLVTYGFNQEQAEMIAGKEKEKDFDILITELNEKIRQKKLKVENSVGYLVGIYQKKGILPIKN